MPSPDDKPCWPVPYQGDPVVIAVDLEITRNGGAIDRAAITSSTGLSRGAIDLALQWRDYLTTPTREDTP